MVGNFRDLKVWEKAHQVTLDVYKATALFPRDEMYGLTGQLRRASASIPTNIAEGSGRDSDNELIRFLHIAMGSAAELDYQLLLARDLNFLELTQYDGLSGSVAEVQRMLASLIHGLKTKD
jgi:four helix bundle protein